MQDFLQFSWSFSLDELMFRSIARRFLLLFYLRCPQPLVCLRPTLSSSNNSLPVPFALPPGLLPATYKPQLSSTDKFIDLLLAPSPNLFDNVISGSLCCFNPEEKRPPSPLPLRAFALLSLHFFLVVQPHFAACVHSFVAEVKITSDGRGGRNLLVKPQRLCWNVCGSPSQ